MFKDRKSPHSKYVMSLQIKLCSQQDFYKNPSKVFIDKENNFIKCIWKVKGLSNLRKNTNMGGITMPDVAINTI